jgi:hypothetical protein
VLSHIQSKPESFDSETFLEFQLTASSSPTGPTWLWFADSSLILEHAFTDVYIPFDCEFLVAREDLRGHVTLLEVYRMNRTMPLLSLQLAVWSLQFGLLWDERSLYERRNHLHGVRFKAVTFQVKRLLSEHKITF